MAQKQTTVVTLLSGGLDSSTLLYFLRREYPLARIIALSFDYGQRHRERELLAARDIALELRGVDHRVVDLSAFGTMLSGSALTDRSVAVPDGHYADDTMRATVVPNRNMVMLSLGAAVAVAEHATVLAFGAHAGDHAVYPDCRPLFAHMMQATLQIANEGFIEPTFSLVSPFINIKKEGIVDIAQSLGVPFKLTYSCYKGGILHCGTCGTCTERKEAFTLAGVDDPTAYENTYFRIAAD